MVQFALLLSTLRGYLIDGDNRDKIVRFETQFDELTE
jgi:hypothetical protein